MADLEEIAENPRTGEWSCSTHVDEGNPTKRNSRKQKRSRKRRNSGGSQESVQTSPSVDTRASEERREDDEGVGQAAGQLANDQKPDVLPVQENPQAVFYKDYRKVAEEYDKEFMKKYDEDLNTTLIFAGLFSAVASAFIIEVDSQLKYDPSEETAALLRVLIYKIDNTTFGNEVPTLPQRDGPSPAIIHVQAILFASLAASLFSAFLAMLGKQWLNRYDSTDMRGTAIDRGRNRQGKLDGIVGWYFDNVMESLPLMLQAALLLFSCALSRYLWGIDTTIASVVLGVTSFGVLGYLFIVIAGTVSESCPYQTPGAHILRHHVLPALRSTSSKFSGFIKNSYFLNVLKTWRGGWKDPNDLVWSIIRSLILPLSLPTALAVDVSPLGPRIVQSLVSVSRTVYHRFMATPLQMHDLSQQTITLDLRCVSWMLQTSLDKAFHLTALKYLTSIPELVRFHPSLVIGCFNVFISCINVVDETPVIVQGLEQLATLSASCFFRTLRHSFTANPTSGTLADLRRRYSRAFPSGRVDFKDLPFRYTMIAAHVLVNQELPVGWGSYHNNGPSAWEHAQLAGCIVEVAQVEYQHKRRRKVPRWTLCFALDSLSLDPPAPPSVVADCLKIIAIDLGCDVSTIGTPDESVRAISVLITQKLEIIAGSPAMNTTSNHMAISALVPRAISLAQLGDRELVDAILRVTRTPNPLNSWLQYSGPYTVIPPREPTPPSLNWTTIHLSLYVPWDFWDKIMVDRWAAAVSAVLNSKEVGWSEVDMLLQVASIDNLRPHIPIAIWAWLKEQPPLPPICPGRGRGTEGDLVHHVRGLGDLNILKSYFHLVWSEWSSPYYRGFCEMRDSISENLGGIEMRHHREDLIERLDYILAELDRGLGYFKQHRPRTTEEDIQKRREAYKILRDDLLGVD